MVNEGVSVTFPVKGWSMLPFIIGGEESVILSRPDQQLKVGDIVLARTDDGRYVELQGTAEREPFTEDDLAALRALARGGLKKIFAIQKAAAR